jgi:hypothetical protein
MQFSDFSIWPQKTQQCWNTIHDKYFPAKAGTHLSETLKNRPRLSPGDSGKSPLPNPFCWVTFRRSQINASFETRLAALSG